MGLQRAEIQCTNRTGYYVDLATNITAVCSPARLNVKWTAGGAIPPGITTVIKAGYTEYHICGDLTVSGSGYLTGSAPATDIIIVIENGSLIVDDKSSINTARTAIVLTGNNNWPAKVEFPTGAGKVSTLTLAPPTGAGNLGRLCRSI